MINILRVLFLIAIIVSCASHKKGKYVEFNKGTHPKNLPIRAFVDDRYSTEHFKVVNFHFENQKDEWVEIEGAEILTIDGKNVVKIPDSKDALVWKRAFVERKKIDQHNTNVGKGLAAGALAVLAIAGAVNGNADMTYGSLGALHVGSGIEAANAASSSGNNLENAKLFSENHLYNETKLVPGMTQRKWALVQVKRNTRLCELDFNINYKKYGLVNYSVNMCR